MLFGAQPADDSSSIRKKRLLRPPSLEKRYFPRGGVLTHSLS